MNAGDIVKIAYRYLADGNVSALLGLFDSSITWSEAENSPYSNEQAWQGPAAVKQNLLDRMADDWHTFAIQPVQFHACGETVVVEARYTGVHRRTGRALDAQACHIWSVREGRIVHFQQYADTASLRDATGPV
ncbi:nuclear transport factor 2 family protein [Burkholderia ambifaria]|uniref:nuclear transport factor 2 family protein n=1 Tax=Burkholderia ambifaria TaxID=152480 RepID=UPI003A5BEF6C